LVALFHKMKSLFILAEIWPGANKIKGLSCITERHCAIISNV
jgi:hypothetical protein